MTLKLPLWTLIPGMAVASALLHGFCILIDSKPYIFQSFEGYLFFNFIFAAIILLIDLIGEIIIKWKK